MNSEVFFILVAIVTSSFVPNLQTKVSRLPNSKLEQFRKEGSLSQKTTCIKSNSGDIGCEQEDLKVLGTRDSDINADGEATGHLLLAGENQLEELVALTNLLSEIYSADIQHLKVNLKQCFEKGAVDLRKFRIVRSAFFEFSQKLEMEGYVPLVKQAGLKQELNKIFTMFYVLDRLAKDTCDLPGKHHKECVYFSFKDYQMKVKEVMALHEYLVGVSADLENMNEIVYAEFLQKTKLFSNSVQELRSIPSTQWNFEAGYQALQSKLKNLRSFALVLSAYAEH